MCGLCTVFISQNLRPSRKWVMSPRSALSWEVGICEIWSSFLHVCSKCWHFGFTRVKGRCSCVTWVWNWEKWREWLKSRQVALNTVTSHITGVSIVYLTGCSSADKRKHQGSASLAFVRGIHRWPVNSPHKWPVTRKMFPFDDVIMFTYTWWSSQCEGLGCQAPMNWANNIESPFDLYTILQSMF